MLLYGVIHEPYWLLCVEVHLSAHIQGELVPEELPLHYSISFHLWGIGYRDPDPWVLGFGGRVYMVHHDQNTLASTVGIVGRATK